MEHYTAKEGVWIGGAWFEPGQTFMAAPRAMKYLELKGQVERVALRPAPKPSAAPAPAKAKKVED